MRRKSRNSIDSGDSKDPIQLWKNIPAGKLLNITTGNYVLPATARTKPETDVELRVCGEASEVSVFRSQIQRLRSAAANSGSNGCTWKFARGSRQGGFAENLVCQLTA